jgi:hypothetical protein
MFAMQRSFNSIFVAENDLSCCFLNSLFLSQTGLVLGIPVPDQNDSNPYFKHTTLFTLRCHARISSTRSLWTVSAIQNLRVIVDDKADFKMEFRSLGVHISNLLVVRRNEGERYKFILILDSFQKGA